MAKYERTWHRLTRQEQDLFLTLLWKDGHSEKAIADFFNVGKGTIVRRRQTGLKLKTSGRPDVKQEVDAARFQVLLERANRRAPRKAASTKKRPTPPLAQATEWDFPDRQPESEQEPGEMERWPRDVRSSLNVIVNPEPPARTEEHAETAEEAAARAIMAEADKLPLEEAASDDADSGSPPGQTTASVTETAPPHDDPNEEKHEWLCEWPVAGKSLKPVPCNKKCAVGERFCEEHKRKVRAPHRLLGSL